MTVQFAAGDEPLVLVRGQPVSAWLHARVESVAALSPARQAELASFLADLDGAQGNYGPVLVVSRDGAGRYHLHLFEVDDGTEIRVPVDLAALPSWLQRPEDEDDERPRPPRRRAPTRDRTD